jgi:predicted alpha/beta hydrolase family esterase
VNYVLLHGSGPGPNMWFPWLKGELAKTNADVWTPRMPTSEHPDLSKQLPFLLQSGKITPDSVLVGHSASCPLILSVLENIDFIVPKIVLVAPYFPIPGDKTKIWQKRYDLPKIKSHCQEFVFVVSDNDPWGCNDRLSRPYFDALGGTMVIIQGGGHFGSNHWKQPLYEFPLLLKILS